MSNEHTHPAHPPGEEAEESAHPTPHHGPESEHADGSAPRSPARKLLSRETRFGLAAVLSFAIFATILVLNKSKGSHSSGRPAPVAEIGGRKGGSKGGKGTGSLSEGPRKGQTEAQGANAANDAGKEPAPAESSAGATKVADGSSENPPAPAAPEGGAQAEEISALPTPVASTGASEEKPSPPPPLTDGQPQEGNSSEKADVPAATKLAEGDVAAVLPPPVSEASTPEPGSAPSQTTPSPAPAAAPEVPPEPVGSPAAAAQSPPTADEQDTPKQGEVADLSVPQRGTDRNAKSDSPETLPPLGTGAEEKGNTAVSPLEPERTPGSDQGATGRTATPEQSERRPEGDQPPASAPARADGPDPGQPTASANRSETHPNASTPAAAESSGGPSAAAPPNRNAAEGMSGSAAAKGTETEGGDWVIIPSGGQKGITADPRRSAASAAAGTPEAPIASAPIAREQPEPVLHVVQRGENFWTISRLYYNSGRFYKALWKANRALVDRPEALYVGMTIRIPAPEDLDRSLVDPPASAPAARPTSSSRPAERPLRRASKPVAREGAGAARSPDEGDEPEVTLPIGDALEPTDLAEDRRDAARRLRHRPRHPVYKVRPHETLRSIARDTLGDSRRADEILELNRDVIDDPRHLIVGQLLDLPEDAQLGRRAR